MNVEQQYVLQKAKELLMIDSPSGFCFEAINKVEEWAKDLGYPLERTRKGNGIITIAGKSEEKVIGLCAHVDTLGTMVRSITSEGRLKFTPVGGPIIPTLDGEYCRIRTREGRIYTGTYLSSSPAIHVFEDAATKSRTPENMEIRIDEEVRTKEDVQKLGIAPGDFVFIDPKTVVTESGFLKSRFIDDKGSVACLVGLLKTLKDHGITPEYTVKIILSTYEEVGHGCAYIPSDITELIAVDMGCIGDDLSCTEYDVSICAKDSSGPYDFEITGKFIELAKKNGLSYAVDIYPRYASDVSAAMSGGNDIRGALIGPGVHASHGMERTHYKAMENTIQLLAYYLQQR